MQVLIQTLTGKLIPIEVNNSDAISDVKDKVSEQAKIPYECQRLIFNKKQLLDSETISFYNIKQKDIILLIPIIRGGGIGFHFNRMEQTREQTFAEEDEEREEHQLVCGLNVESICQNPECQYFEQIVTVNIGLGTFDVRDICQLDSYICPICSTKPQDLHKNPELCHCKYQINGTFIPEGKSNLEKYEKKGQVINKYLRFDDEENSKRLWHSLIIKTEEID